MCKKRDQVPSYTFSGSTSLTLENGATSSIEMCRFGMTSKVQHMNPMNPTQSILHSYLSSNCFISFHPFSAAYSSLSDSQ